MNDKTEVLCSVCGGGGLLVSEVPCYACSSKYDDLVAIGAEWKKDSSLEKWFPFTAKELDDVKRERDMLKLDINMLKAKHDDVLEIIRLVLHRLSE